MSGERRAKELNKALQNDKQSLAALLTVDDIRARRVPEELLLTKKRFSHYEHAQYQPVPFTSDLFITSGDYRDGQMEGAYKETIVIVEQNNSPEPMSEDEVKEIAGFLHYRLTSNKILKGLLPCLGYRISSVPELIFAMPEGTERPIMLHTRIAEDHGTPSLALDHRFMLARRLCEAVLRVHGAGLVHKNIRSSTVMTLQAVGTAAGDPSRYDNVYLTDWRLLRESSGRTMKNGSTEWTQNIYRHPKRQGEHIQERYNVGHDLYSLGVSAFLRLVSGASLLRDLRLGVDPRSVRSSEPLQMLVEQLTQKSP
jgi:hypothetical protein